MFRKMSSGKMVVLTKDGRKQVRIDYLKKCKQKSINKNNYNGYQRALYYKQKEIWNSLSIELQEKMIMGTSIDIIGRL